MIIDSNFSILIVEDDSALLKVLSTYLKKAGATVFQATNGQEAYQIVETENIHFVLSDVQMPIMNGVELLKKIRVTKPIIPIVLLATGQAELTKDDALKFGASGLIHKPFKLLSLHDEIVRLMNKSETNF
jgi:CheY-like chemotaxis protein